MDSQAKAFFQWCNYLRDRAAATGKEALYVNLDETPVPICFTHVRGNVVRTGQRSRPRQLATRADTRLYFTLVAMICTEPELQPFLPQLMVVSEKTLRKQDEPAVRAILPDNVYLLRRKSGWNNIETQAEIVTLTKHVLGAHLDRFQVIWVCDACKAHFAPEVMRNMSAACFLALCQSCEIDLAEVAPVAVAAGCTPAAAGLQSSPVSGGCRFRGLGALAR